MKNRRAGASERQPAAKTSDSKIISSSQNPSNTTMTGRELLETLAHNVAELCEMVEGWRDEQDRLRARVAALEGPRHG